MGKRGGNPYEAIFVLSRLLHSTRIQTKLQLRSAIRKPSVQGLPMPFHKISVPWLSHQHVKYSFYAVSNTGMILYVSRLLVHLLPKLPCALTNQRSMYASLTSTQFSNGLRKFPRQVQILYAFSHIARHGSSIIPIVPQMIVQINVRRWTT